MKLRQLKYHWCIWIRTTCYISVLEIASLFFCLRDDHIIPECHGERLMCLKCWVKAISLKPAIQILPFKHMQLQCGLTVSKSSRCRFLCLIIGCKLTAKSSRRFPFHRCTHLA